MNNFHDEQIVKREAYTYILFRKAGKYIDAQGFEQDVLEPVRPLTAYDAFRSMAAIKGQEDSEFVIKVSLHGEDHFENYADVLQRRSDLEILRHLTSYSNAGQVREADEFHPLDGQLYFPWAKLIANYKWVLSDDEQENKCRLVLLELLYNYRTGNRSLKIQEYLDKASDGFPGSMKAASEYLRLFEAQGFIGLTDYYTIVPKKIKEFYDEHFKEKDKDGRW